MALHDDLLSLARRLVDQNPGSPVEADLRRGVSTAYYAVFHLLVFEATNELIAKISLRPRVSRAFQHPSMKAVCREYADLRKSSAAIYITSTGEVVPLELLEIAAAFNFLQEARHHADYDTTLPLTYAAAQSYVSLAEESFRNWDIARSDQSASTFLTELFCRSIPKR